MKEKSLKEKQDAIKQEKKDAVLTKARHGIGLYSIKEICKMFQCSRHHIDNAINSNKLQYMSPNNRDRYIYLKDFLNLMQCRGGD